jgi:hypothetical protein
MNNNNTIPLVNDDFETENEEFPEFREINIKENDMPIEESIEKETDLPSFIPKKLIDMSGEDFDCEDTKSDDADYKTRVEYFRDHVTDDY